MGEVGVLVCSCDKNMDLWDMFFYYWYKHWNNCNYKIYLNTETKKYCGKYQVEVLNYTEKSSHERWSLRLKESLKAMKEEYVLLTLDDFFLTGDVDEEEFHDCIKRMDNDRDIACFCFDPVPQQSFACEYEKFERRGKKAPYRFNLQMGLWRKKYLIKYLRNHESPWQFEQWGSIRSRRYKQKFFSLKKGAKRIFEYPIGGVLCDGKWNIAFVEDCLDFIKKDFNITFKRRGFIRKGDSRNWSLRKRNFFQKCWGVFKSLI